MSVSVRDIHFLGEPVSRCPVIACSAGCDPGSGSNEIGASR